MDRRTLLAITLCLLIYVGWQKFYLEPHLKSQPTPQNQEIQKESSITTEKSLSPSAQPISQVQKPAQKQSLQLTSGDAFIGNGGNFFEDWNLKNYRLGISPSAEYVDLSSVTQQQGEMGLAFEDSAYAYLAEVQGKLTEIPGGAQWSYEDKNVKLTRDFFYSKDQTYIDVQVKAEFKTKKPNYAFVSLTGKSPEKDPEAQDRQLVYWSNQSLEKIALKDSIQQKEIPTGVKYMATTNRYFMMAVLAQSQVLPNGLIQPQTQGGARMSLVFPVQTHQVTIPLRVYFGPKDLNILRQVDPVLDHTVDFGWLTFFAYPLLKTLKWLYQFINNYGLSIIILTLLLKVLTYPLTYKSMKSMKKMAKLQPQLQKLRDRYKDDREALNREMLTLMKTQGYNPMAGCLPILIQMPVFFALYRVLYSSIELYHAPFLLWIKDLSSHDPYYVTPVILSLTMFIQQKLTPTTATDPAQARMMQLMPLIFGALMWSLPAGLTLYMLTNAIASIFQQLILNKKFEHTNASA